LKQSISNGIIGIPGLVTINHLQGYSWANGWSAWQQNGKKSGGRIIHFGIHDLDFACWVMESRPVSVRTIASKKIDQAITSWTSYSAQILFESGALALVTGNWDVIPTNYWRKTCSVIGSTGTIQYDSAEDEISLNSRNTEPVGYLASIINELKHWSECLVGNTEPIVSIEQARMSLALAVAAQNSAENHGATVEIEEILHG
jgi:predicted dehydrogenase